MNNVFIVFFIVIVIVTVIYNTRYKEYLTDLWDSNIANSKITQIASSALNNILNGLRSAFKVKKPGKKPCPPGMDDDGLSCWYNSYGRGAGRERDWESCPSGSKDVAGTCWLDSSCHTSGGDCTGGACRTVDNGYYNYSWGCDWGFRNCRNDYHKMWIVRLETHCDPIHCNPVVTTGCPYVTKNIGDRARFCRGDEDQYGTLCYPKCRAGFHPVGCCVCEPDGGPGIRLNAFDRIECPPPGEPDYRKQVGLLCYYQQP